MIARRVGVGVAALGLALFALGVAVLPLQLPAFTRALSERYSRTAEAGLSPERMSQVAESVRAYVVAREGSLPTQVDGRPGFDAAAVGHLDDVARVLAGARVAVAFLALALGAVGIVMLRRGHREAVSAALGAGAAATLGLPLFAAAAAVVDFDSFFAAFHSLFFASGTWTFSYDSLLIRTFPESFWVASGVAWALLVAGVACLYAASWAVLRRSGR